MQTFSTLALASLAAISLTSAAPMRNSTLDPRYCQQNVFTVVADDPNPQQGFVHKQVSSNVNCGSQSCSIGWEESTSYTIGFSATLTPADWIDGGFDVSETFETGQTTTCNGNPGDTICIWWNIPQTTYTVQDMAQDSCGGDAYDDGGQYTITSPNQNDPNNAQYCVAGSACQVQGYQYTDTCTCAGPPGTDCGCT